MANDCGYDMVVVGKTRESLDRMERILDHKDGEFFLYRVFDVATAELPELENGFWRMMLVGNMAWSAAPWITEKPDSAPSTERGARMSNLQEICKALDVGVEVYYEEYGKAIQGHFIVNHDGIVVESKFMQDLEVEVDEEGFPDFVDGMEDYGSWDEPAKIYGDAT